MLRSSVSSPAPGQNSMQQRRSPGLLLLALAAALSVGIVVAAFLPGSGPGQVQDVSVAFNQPDGIGVMNSTFMGALVAILFVALGSVAFLWTYNGLVNREEQVFAAWGQVESNLQRRADLTPQLIETVSRYLRHESQTFQNVAESRSPDLAGLQSTIDELAEATKQSTEQLEGQQRIVEDEESLGALASAQARMNRSIKHLIATAEAYPELRSSTSSLGCRRSSRARRTVSTSPGCASTNWLVRIMPQSGAFPAPLLQAREVQRKAYFEAESQAREMPRISTWSSRLLACLFLAGLLLPTLLVASWWVSVAGDPVIVDDRAGLLSVEQRAGIKLQHAFLLEDHDIDYRIVTTGDAGDMVRSGAERFKAMSAGSLSKSGRGLLLMV